MIDSFSAPWQVSLTVGQHTVIGYFLLLGVFAFVAGIVTFLSRERAAAASARDQDRLGGISRRTSQGSTPLVFGVFGICAALFGLLIVGVSLYSFFSR